MSMLQAFYSIFKASAGLIRDALKAWMPTVRKAIIIALADIIARMI
jgi:hypothetical protein